MSKDFPRLDIGNEMRCFDKKDRDFYSSLTPEELKKFGMYLMIRWGSSVIASTDIQAYYLMSVNENLNKHFFTINKHPKLQWLCATAASPGIGTFRHQWITPKKKDAGSNAIKKQLLELFPNMKSADVDTLSKITTQKEIDQYLRDHGHNYK
jgi:hypothetical protein